MDNPGRTATGQLGGYGYTNQKSERPATEILKDIVDRGQEIIRSEVLLAKTEVKQEAAVAWRASQIGIVGAVLGLYGLGFLFLCAVYALELVLPAWAAALIVAVVLLIPAGVFAAMARERLATMKKPEKTIQGAKEIVNG